MVFSLDPENLTQVVDLRLGVAVDDRWWSRVGEIRKTAITFLVYILAQIYRHFILVLLGALKSSSVS